jgi:hypothetical protein
MLYAHIANGKVVEIFTPPPGMSMSQLFHPNLVWVDITGRNPQPQPGWDAVQQSGAWIITAPVARPVTNADRARNLLASSAQVQSVSNDQLNGNYPIDAETRADLMAEMVSLAVNATFTNGATSLDWPDTDGNFHSFDIERFRSYATAVGVYITTLKRIANGASDPLPTQPIKIT